MRHGRLMLEGERHKKERPRVIVYDRPTTKLIYGIPDTLEYGRWMNTYSDGSQMWAKIAAVNISNIQGLLKSARILIIGCGCGYQVEGLKDAGFTRIWGIDMGPYFPMLWGPTPTVVGGVTLPVEVRSDIRPLLAQLDSRTMTNTQVRNLTGTNNMRFDLIVTEDILPGFTIAEMTAVLDSCDAWLATGSSQVRHMVTPEWPSDWFGSGAPNWTIEQWQAHPDIASRPKHIVQTITDTVIV